MCIKAGDGGYEVFFIVMEKLGILAFHFGVYKESNFWEISSCPPLIANDPL